MASELITNLTMDQLRAVIRDEIEQHLTKTPRDADEIKRTLAQIEKLRWTPPPGSRSAMEFLREDRDR